MNTVAPGFIATEMLEHIPEKVLDGIKAKIPLGRLGAARRDRPGGPLPRGRSVVVHHRRGLGGQRRDGHVSHAVWTVADPRYSDEVRAALVTGAASGIGAAIAARLEDDGWDVLSVDVRGDVDLHADLTTREGNRDAVTAAVERFGRLDAVIPNAGFQHVSPIEEFPEDRWDAIIALLLTSPFLLARYAWPHLRASGRGRFVAIASVHGLVASPYKAAYVSAKHGVLGLVKTLALEGAEHGISATAVCPAYVRTPLVEGQIADQAAGPRHVRGARPRGSHPRPPRRQAPDRARRGRGHRRVPARAGRPGVHRVLRWSWTRAGPPDDRERGDGLAEAAQSGGVELVDQLLDSLGDLVAGGADLVDGATFWVGEVPVEVALAGDVGALVAAAHGDHEVGFL